MLKKNQRIFYATVIINSLIGVDISGMVEELDMVRKIHQPLAIPDR